MKPKRKQVNIAFRHEIYNRDNYTCVYCNKNEHNVFYLTLDHVKPLSFGGTYDKENLVTCCRKCNWNKGCKPKETFN